MLLRARWQARALLSRLAASRLSQARSITTSSKDFPQTQTTTPIIKKYVVDDDLRETGSRAVQERVAELERAQVDPYPRWTQQDFTHGYDTVNQGVRPSLHAGSFSAIKRRVSLAKEDNAFENSVLRVAGRIVSMRESGSKLAFIDLEDGGEKVQVVLNFGVISHKSNATLDEFRSLVRLLQRGDHVSVGGFIARNKRDEPTIRATELPVLRSPCLQRLPVALELEQRDIQQDFAAGRHVEMLTYPGMVNILKIRALVIKAFRNSMEKGGFIEVQTPILGADAGGAAARPFQTVATEFKNRKLSLRIAPELWLKRLIVGGMSQVYEIGPCFRNEGLDKTHNPEFTTCEFYATYLNIDRLMVYTERIMSKVRGILVHNGPPNSCDDALLHELDKPPHESYAKLDFILSINAALGQPLPNLDSVTARGEILSIFEKHSLPVPDLPTLPRLLDKLCSHFLEPQCHAPTWIVNIPECLSPLSKSFIHPIAPNEQPVAARAELFVRGKEIVNCYEEENSPFEQRRKFLDQQRWARHPDREGVVDDEVMPVDEDYIRALEWGLPPTGGWGCGIDRLVMLITGQERITDVLSFGNLRAVTRGADRWEAEKETAITLEAKKTAHKRIK